MNAVELTRKLIDIPSITGEEHEVARFLANHLEELGYKVELQEVEPRRHNIIAGLRKNFRIAFSTHLDTVPPYFPPAEDGEFIYGRGSCDAKGIIAAQIFAAEKLRAAGIDDVGLLFVVDEETGSLGARAANDHPAASRVEYLINGEPTENRLAAGTKGSLRVVIRTTGKAGHSAYPEHGDSAIEKLLDVLDDIRNCQWPADELFGETTCNIGAIGGGVRPNVIPAAAQADLQFRLATDSEPVKRRLFELIDNRAEVELLSEANPIRLLALDGFEQEAVRFMTDIPFLSNWGTPLLSGPGSILDAHTDHERISKQQLFEAVNIYERLAYRLLSQKKPAVEVVENFGRVGG